MKKFCGCTDDWVVDNAATARQILGTGCRDQKSMGCCRKCRLYFWYDVDHENMMHDLRQMNQM